jgi:hypothetical protein
MKRIGAGDHQEGAPADLPAQEDRVLHAPASPARAIPTGRFTLGPDGRRLCVAGPDGVTLVEIGGAPRRLTASPAVCVAAFGDQIWTLHGGDRWLVARYRATGDAAGELIDCRPLPCTGQPTRALWSRLAPSLILHGPRSLELRAEPGGNLQVRRLDLAPAPIVPLGPRSWIEQRGPDLLVRRPDGSTLPLRLGGVLDATLVGGSPLVDGSLAALELCSRGAGRVVVVELERGEPILRAALGGAALVAYAERLGHAVLQHDRHRLTVLDLVTGRSLGQHCSRRPIRRVAVDASGRCAVLSSDSPDTPLRVASYADLFAIPRAAAPAPQTLSAVALS